MNHRPLLLATLLIVRLVPVAGFAGGEDKIVNEAAAATTTPYRFSAEFRVEQSYVGESDVARENRDVNNFEELYSNLTFVYTPRIKFGIIRAGAEFERYSFGFSGSGQELPNSLQTVAAIVGFDTQFSDSILVRLEAQPGFYGTTFDHFDGNQFNVPFILGGTYIYSPSLQFVFGVGFNGQQKYPVLPGGGVRWKFAPNWVLDAVLPTPRLEYNFNRNLQLFISADIKAQTFRTDDRFGDAVGDSGLNNAWLSYEELRVGAGLAWKLSSSLTLTVEGGYVPYREFDYHRTEVRYHHESGAPYGSISLQGAF